MSVRRTGTAPAPQISTPPGAPPAATPPVTEAPAAGEPEAAFEAGKPGWRERARGMLPQPIRNAHSMREAVEGAREMLPEDIKAINDAEGAKNAARAYFSDPTNTTHVALSATRGTLKGAGYVLRGMPVVGNVLSGASAVCSIAKACVDTHSLIKEKDPELDKGDVAAAWGRAAADVAGIFFPPLGVAGRLGVSAYKVYDLVEEHRSESAQPPQAPVDP